MPAWTGRAGTNVFIRVFCTISHEGADNETVEKISAISFWVSFDLLLVVLGFWFADFLFFFLLLVQKEAKARR